MAEVTFKVHGLRELKAALEQLPREIQGKVLAAAANAGAGVIKQRAIELAPEGETGNLKRAIYQRTLRGLPPSQARVWVSVRKGRARDRRRLLARYQAGRATAAEVIKWGGNQAPYAHFVEFGTVKMAARPFLRPAVHEKAGEAVEKMKAALRSRIESAARKLAKRAA